MAREEKENRHILPDLPPLERFTTFNLGRTPVFALQFKRITPKDLIHETNLISTRFSIPCNPVEGTMIAGIIFDRASLNDILETFIGLRERGISVRLTIGVPGDGHVTTGVYDSVTNGFDIGSPTLVAAIRRVQELSRGHWPGTLRKPDTNYETTIERADKYLKEVKIWKFDRLGIFGGKGISEENKFSSLTIKQLRKILSWDPPSDVIKLGSLSTIGNKRSILDRICQPMSENLEQITIQGRAIKFDLVKSTRLFTSGTWETLHKYFVAFFAQLEQEVSSLGFSEKVFFEYSRQTESITLYWDSPKQENIDALMEKVQQLLNLLYRTLDTRRDTLRSILGTIPEETREDLNSPANNIIVELVALDKVFSSSSKPYALKTEEEPQLALRVIELPIPTNTVVVLVGNTRDVVNEPFAHALWAKREEEQKAAGDHILQAQLIA